VLDLTRPYDAHIDRRLRTEPIIWFGTVSSPGAPHLVPMWFLWEKSALFLFSLPDTRNLRDLAVNASVVALDAADQGYDIVILEGRAILMNDPQVTAMMPSFMTKYAEIPRRWPPEAWAKKFSQVIRVTPTKLTAWITKPGASEERRTHDPGHLTVPTRRSQSFQTGGGDEADKEIEQDNQGQ
jgi:PPOX class probable F420-dependent enzyme